VTIYWFWSWLLHYITMSRHCPLSFRSRCFAMAKLNPQAITCGNALQWLGYGPGATHHSGGRGRNPNLNEVESRRAAGWDASGTPVSDEAGRGVTPKPQAVGLSLQTVLGPLASPTHPQPRVIRVITW
jgi:hypothetical protein